MYYACERDAARKKWSPDVGFFFFINYVGCRPATYMPDCPAAWFVSRFFSLCRLSFSIALLVAFSVCPF